MIHKKVAIIGVGNMGKAIAQVLAKQTAIGSACIYGQSDQPATYLRKAVTSIGGTTDAAINEFEKDKFPEVFARGVRRAFERSKELSMSVSN